MSENIQVPSAEEQDRIYSLAVLSALPKILEALDTVFQSGIQFPEPLPPRPAAAAISHAVMIASILVARDHGLKLEHIESVFNAVKTQAAGMFPDLLDPDAIPTGPSGANVEE